MTKLAGRKQLWLYLLGGLLVLAAWHQVFAMTGVLWWNAPEPDQRVATPAALPEARVDTAWVDPPAYLKTHPEWNPH
jgi:hypothetical protein